MGRAALRLRLTQPAVSKTLAELEAIVGRRLLDRGRHGARPTREGEQFLPHAKAVLDALAAAGRAMSETGPTSPVRVTVGALPTVAPDVLPGAVERFRRTTPGASLELRSATNARLLEQLRTGDLDLAVGRMSDPSLTTELTFELLYLESLAAAVRPGHPLAGRARVSCPRLLEFPLAVCTAGTTPRLSAEAVFRSHGLQLPPDTIDTLDLAVARQIVLSTDTVWLVPAGAVRGDVARGWLALLPVDVGGTAEPVGLFRRTSGPPVPAADSFAGHLRAVAAARRGAPQNPKRTPA